MKATGVKNKDKATQAYLSQQSSRVLRTPQPPAACCVTPQNLLKQTSPFVSYTAQLSITEKLSYTERNEAENINIGRPICHRDFERIRPSK